jgi:hypothetical protein
MMKRVRGTKKWSQLHKSNPSIPPKNKGRDILISPDELEDCDEGTNELHPMSTPGNKDLPEFVEPKGQLNIIQQTTKLSPERLALGDTQQTLKDEIKGMKLTNLEDTNDVVSPGTFRH